MDRFTLRIRTRALDITTLAVGTVLLVLLLIYLASCAPEGPPELGMPPPGPAVAD